MVRHVFLLLLSAFSFAQTPNVVLVLADDLGYGDVTPLNPDSRIPTPAFERLAAEGVTFTDAHSPSAVCTPTRYGVLTGTYCWRSRMKSGVLGGYSPPLLDPGQETLGTIMQRAGYRTAAIGKWHLGMTLPKLGEDVNTSTWAGDPGIDWDGTITDGPTHHGFDHYFGVSASLDMAPYVYIRGTRFQHPPSLQQEHVNFPHFVRKGPRSVDFVIENVLDDLTKEAVDFVTEAANDSVPFFLYMPLTAPHKPTQPHDHFRGTTGLGEYGDFIAQTDWTIGRVLKALDDTGQAENTLVIVTSDNGSYMYRRGELDNDHVTQPTAHGYHPDHHTANGPWRGTKADIYEAGHRVPFFVRWPKGAPAGERRSGTICHVDFFATLCELTGQSMPEGAAQDSYSFWPRISNPDAPRGGPVVHHSGNGTFALRAGKWKAIFCTGSGGREQPKGKPFDGTRLFDMEADPGETTDVAAKHPEVVARMTATLAELRGE